MVVVYLIRDHFFFQAEDGIRDLYVTGVQTCALPIWVNRARRRAPRARARGPHARGGEPKRGKKRSEERRVGKGVDIGGLRIIKKKKLQIHLTTIFGSVR